MNQIKFKINLTGKTFGRWTVIAPTNLRNSSNKLLWKCKCDCGNVKFVAGETLRTGQSRSCGCLFLERSAALGRTNTKPRVEKGKAGFTALREQYKSGAKRRGIKWLLSEKDLREIVTKKCFYCGVQPGTVRLPSRKKCSRITEETRANGVFISNGIDRIDNNGDYTAENVVACCGRCNEAKMDQTLADFSRWIQSLEDWSKSKCKILRKKKIKYMPLHKRLMNAPFFYFSSIKFHYMKWNPDEDI